MSLLLIWLVSLEPPQQEPGDPRHDDLDPARGVLVGVVLGLAGWLLLIATCYAVVRR